MTASKMYAALKVGCIGFVCVMLISSSVMLGVSVQALKPPDIISISWSPDGLSLVETGASGIVRLWDTKESRVEREITLNKTTSSIVWKMDSTQFATASSDGFIRVWNSASGQMIAALAVEPSERILLSWSADGRKLASLSTVADGPFPLRIWETLSGNFNLLATFPGIDAYEIAWSPDSTELAVAGFGGVFISSDILSASPKSRSIGSFSTSLAWTPDGKLLATGSGEGLINIYDPSTGQQQLTLRGHGNGSITHLAWSPDAALLASAGNDETIRVWDMATNQTIQVLPKKSYWIVGSSAAWSPCGGQLAYVGEQASGATRRTRSFGDSDLRIITPASSPERLNRLLAYAVHDPDLRAQLEGLVGLTTMSAFAERVKALPPMQLSSACAADLLAVANTLPGAAPTFKP